MKSLFFLTLFLNFATLPAFGFENEFLSFDLPPAWMCYHEKPNWICSPQSKTDVREALIIVSAKAAGPEDSVKNYFNHLSKPKMLRTGPKKLPKPSKVIHAKFRMLGPQQWVEGFHLSSEVPDFYTLYLATKSQDLSVLLSLSADRKVAKKYDQTFRKVVQTLKLKPLTMRRRLTKTGTGIAPVDQAVDATLQQLPSSQTMMERFLGSNLLIAMAFAFGALLIAIVVYAIKD